MCCTGFPTEVACAVVWTAVFGGRVASSFGSLGRHDKYILGAAYILSVLTVSQYPNSDTYASVAPSAC